MKAWTFPARFESPSGLSMELNANGSIRRIDHRDILINLFLGNEIEGGAANLFLRKHGTAIESVPLLGPQSPAASVFDDNGFHLRGEWNGIRFQLCLSLAPATPGWFWHGRLENIDSSAAVIDLVYAQDLALAHYGAVRMNEYYVSQYVDYTPLDHPRCGTVLAVRQNLSMGGRNPWILIGSLRRAISYATDALQLYGLGRRGGAIADALRLPTLPGKRLQHEHSMAVLQDAPLHLAAGESAACGFFAWFEENHAAASGDADLAFADRALTAAPGETEMAADGGTPQRPDAATLFSARPILQSLDLTPRQITKLFGKDVRNAERDGKQMLSFFCGTHQHVVLKAKELRALRPHGHLIRSGDHLVPDEASLTSTTWMNGVFHCLLTQGHVNINRLLSTPRSYLSLYRSAGQRIFVQLKDGYHLLDVPSAYEMTPNRCRWLYKHAAGLIEVCSSASLDRHELHISVRVISGAACRFLITHHIALNGDDGAEAIPPKVSRDAQGWDVSAAIECDISRRFPEGFFRIAAAGDTTIAHVGGDECLFVDQRSRRQPFVCVRVVKTKSAALRITGHLIPDAGQVGQAAGEQPPDRFWEDMAGALKLQDAPRAARKDSDRIQEILPWLAHNALIHYLAPRGLEQFSGGGWGTRDVCQGPVEMLLALGRWEPLRDLLQRVFKTQNADGDWPQWFMFFERERGIRPNDSHGDIVFWPLLALAQYVIASEDTSIFDVQLPFFHHDGDEQAEKATLWEHVERALSLIERRVIPGTCLAAYGHGDWNDSLQPVDAAMSERLCSAWTVTLHHQTLTTLSEALRRSGRDDRAAALAQWAERVKEEFHSRLIADATIPGYAYFEPDGRIDYLLHPSDRDTGIHYSLLPMIHAILNDLLTPKQAAAHVRTIHKHLLGADGARLFDRPFAYCGGPQRRFQRAESSTFFGREIGIMYTHAHLRYAEAMAHYGDAKAFLLALRQVIPIGIRAAVPAANPRQANCYYSSSDAAFMDRYEALAQYDKVKSGAVPFEGGWRVYSSGAGIALRLVHECLLGIRRRASSVVLDPVIPAPLNGLRAEVELAGARVTVVYLRKKTGYGPQAVTLNGKPLPFERGRNPYREAGVEISLAAIREHLAGENTLQIQLG